MVCFFAFSWNIIVYWRLFRFTEIPFADSLNSLTENKVPTWSKLVPSSLMSGSTQKSNKTTAGPIPDQMLMVILYFLFPDADDSDSVRKIYGF